MSDLQLQLESQLNDFCLETRQSALNGLLQLVDKHMLALPPQGSLFNLHCHTNFSFNGYGYSPTALAWRGRQAGLYAMGVVDFDVLDATSEFLDAAQKLDLRSCAGFETRIFIPEFSERVINSPGEPGISYHMGLGFTGQKIADQPLLNRLKDIAQNRNRNMLERVNAHLDTIALDYEKDVIPLTPGGNPTERHLCAAYFSKAEEVYPDMDQRARFWMEKLDLGTDDVVKALDDPPAMQNLIRAKTMKAGGVGYVKPEGPDFPRLDEVNAFTLANGAIPTMTWLDGTSDGEKDIDELLDLMVASGVAAVNIIPDRNWNIADEKTKALKVNNFNHFVELAVKRDLPVVVGTEMNAYGQKFVDCFCAPEMAVHYDVFIQGARLMHAHTVLQAHAGMGYLSDWAKANFDATADKNYFYSALGDVLTSQNAKMLERITPELDPDEIAISAGIEKPCGCQQ